MDQQGMPKPAHRAPREVWQPLAARLLPWIMVSIAAVGVFLRLSQYLLDRSLFLDEAFVATSIVKLTYAELAKPILFDQRAPAGFLFAVKLVEQNLGDSDLALRLVPLLCGTVSVVLFWTLCRRWLGPMSAALAFATFALSPTLIFYSSELKQYSADVLATLAVLLASTAVLQAPERMHRWLCLGVMGGAFLWFSFPLVFVLAALGAALGAWRIAARDRRGLAGAGLAATCWLAGFAGIYWVQLRHFASDPNWKALWQDTFMPFPPRSLADFAWLASKYFDIAQNPVGLSFAGLAGFAWLLGLMSLSRRRPMHAVMLYLPILAVLLASGLRIYPCSGRVVLFFAPLVILTIAEGVRRVALVIPTAGVLLAGMLLAHPIGKAARHVALGTAYANPLFWNYRREEAKPALAFIRARWQPGDMVYLYGDSYVAVEHYSPRFGFVPSDSLRGIPAGLANPTWREIRDDLDRLRGRPRVWMFFTHTWQLNGVDDQRLYRYFCDEIGVCRAAFESQGIVDGSAYLYDFSVAPPVHRSVAGPDRAAPNYHPAPNDNMRR